jgi:hypothetical protein
MEAQKKAEDTLGKTVQTFFGFGLSQLIRYSYGGFFGILVALVVSTGRAQRIIDAAPWELVALVAFVVGAGMYALHRSVAVPVHHLILTGFLRLLDHSLAANQSFSPTRWLGDACGVRPGWKMVAYSTLRRSEFFTDTEKDTLDIAHAEAGLILMSAELLWAAAMVPAFYREESQIGWFPLTILGFALFVLSFSFGIFQHRVECARFHEKPDKVKEMLEKYGIPRTQPNQPPQPASGAGHPGD